MRVSVVLSVAVIALNDRRAVRRYSDVLVRSLPDGVRKNIQTLLLEHLEVEFYRINVPNLFKEWQSLSER
jgi:hypothetical protein